MEAMMSSSPDHNQSRVAQEALLTPVCDTGHSEVLRGRLLGTQPFDKGLGFSHQEGELRAWDQDRRKAQVCPLGLSSLSKGHDFGHSLDFN